MHMHGLGKYFNQRSFHKFDDFLCRYIIYNVAADCRNCNVFRKQTGNTKAPAGRGCRKQYFPENKKYKDISPLISLPISGINSISDLVYGGPWIWCRNFIRFTWNRRRLYYVSVPDLSYRNTN